LIFASARLKALDPQRKAKDLKDLVNQIEKTQDEAEAARGERRAGGLLAAVKVESPLVAP
jgi:hypothetical protein